MPWLVAYYYGFQIAALVFVKLILDNNIFWRTQFKLWWPEAGPGLAVWDVAAARVPGRLVSAHLNTRMQQSSVLSPLSLGGHLYQDQEGSREQSTSFSKHVSYAMSFVDIFYFFSLQM